MIKSVLLIVLALLFPACGEKDTVNDRSETAASDESNGENSDIIETNLTYGNFAHEALEKHCATCHTIPPRFGAPYTFRLDSYDDKDDFPGAYEKREAIKKSIEDGSMPPDASLDQETKDKFIEWVRGGAKKGDETVPEKQAAVVPTISVITPGIENDAPVNNSYQLSVSITNSEAALNWGIYYSSVKGATADGTTIVTNRAVTDTSYTWDTSGLADGTYYIYVLLLTKSNGFVRSASNGSISIVTPPP